MANNIQLIGCTNVRVAPDCENIVLVNCSDEEYTSDNSNTSNFQNGALVIGSDGITTGSFENRKTTITGNSGTDIDVDTYFCDATAGVITVTMLELNQTKIFVKTDATVNNVLLVPNSGLVNGVASFPLTAQNQKVTVVFDGTNFYV